MSKTKYEFTPTGQGPDGNGSEVNMEVPEVSKIKEWMLKDLGTCITFLTALHNDGALQDVMATFLQGRIQNYRNARVDPNQKKIFQD